ncbi:MAG TPA: hypothetical protein VIC56_00850 [Gemmatimonadota bacterium]
MIVRDVVKVGGSVSRDPQRLREVLRALAAIDPLPLVVPGGGALADAVRALHAGGGPSEETAHRMALLALDAMALWMAEAGGESGGADGSSPGVGPRTRPPRVVRDPHEAGAALLAGRLPVLAPATWLERESELPASWRVTSDSIAAWVAGRLGARRLLLVKSFTWASPEAGLGELGDVVDDAFADVLPAGVECLLVEGRTDAVTAALAGAGGTRVAREGARVPRGAVRVR